ncbi:MAG: TolB family protein [Candidatus Acidiferrales bacterium]
MRTCRRISAVWTTSHYAMAVIGALVVAALPAFATFAGANGRIAYTRVSGDPMLGYTSVIFAAGSGQLTHPPAGMYDSEPAWSADGSQLAFVRTTGTSPYATSKASIEIINQDGSGERTLISSDTLDGFLGESGTPEFNTPTWSLDGKYLAFVYYTSVPGSGGTIANLYGGLYRINVDGSELQLMTNSRFLLTPRFSSRGDLAVGMPH